MGSLDYETNYGDEEDQEQKKALQSIMRKLKSGEYSKVLVGIREKLGLAPKISCVQMEALLIHAAENRFQEDTMARDIVLMSWGLLQGYDNHRTLQEPKDFQTAFAERSEKFLRESSYISKKYKNGKYVSYEVAQAAIITRETKNGKFEGNALKPIREALQKAGEYAINRLADCLYETNMAEYIKEIEIQDYFELDYIPSNKLPILLNARDDGPTEESLIVDIEQGANDDPINLANEFDECEPETYTDDEPTSMLSPDSPEDTEESSEELFGQDSLLSLEELKQSIEDSNKAFWDKPEDEPDPGTSILPANKWKKGVMILIICFILGIAILGSYPLFQEGGIKAVIKDFLQSFIISVAIIIAMIIAILALGLLSEKAYDIFHARKNNAKTHRSYTVQKIKDGILGKRIVFNSISDGPVGYGYKGNEKKFVSAGKIKDRKVAGMRFGFIEAEDGAEYLIRVFIHNDNPNGYDAVAKYCRVKICIPDIPSKKVRVRGIISSDNARPREYWDSVTFYNLYTPFRLDCLEPVMLYNDGIGQNGYSLDQRIIDSEGALIGYDYCDGKIPGGDGYESNILLKVKVVFDDNFVVKFKGRNYGPYGWQHTIEADVWDEVSFQIGYKNSSNAKGPQQNVTVSIDLPECLCYVPESAFLDLIPHPVFNNRPSNYSQLFLPDGLDIGDFNPGAGARIRFNADVVDRGLCSGCNEVLATVKVSVGEVTNYDTVKIIINKE